jgi:energy-dependent translational throttle protein EttA
LPPALPCSTASSGLRWSPSSRRNSPRVTTPALEQFAGCAIVISHDRWFLDRIATHILAFEGESKVTFFDGNFTEYEDWRKQQLGDAATRPHRITYRKLTR